MNEKYQMWNILDNGKSNIPQTTVLPILALWDFDRVQGQGHSRRPTM